mmetsp:Transcript_14513/g.17945  ORF Transcript_14513/g.17945 Transcript_14513/m.17945 type:complete len:83 (-) Transcript_14513:1448-1696(-)
MSQLFQRIANFLANEMITKRLANSRAFQRWALKTHEHVEKGQDLASTGHKHVSKHAETIHTETKGFFTQLREELKKEWGLKK